MYTFSDWLDLHNVSHTDLRGIVCSLRGTGILSREAQICLLPEETPCDDAASQIAASFKSYFGTLVDISDCFDDFCDIQNNNEVSHPHTNNLGEQSKPNIEINFQGSVADRICLAHEMGHALQIHLTNGQFIPPLKREIAAFIGELIYLNWAEVYLPGEAKALRNVWCRENNRYCGSDLDRFIHALDLPHTEYHYRLNYPLARMLASFAFEELALPEIFLVFKGDFVLSDLLNNFAENEQIKKMKNYLPELPEHDEETPELSSYRALGAMALLDIDYWNGESEKSIGDYFNLRLDHLKDATALVALNDERQPIGYANWKPLDNGQNSILLTRQAAPFGDHLTLQKKLEERLPDGCKVLSASERSARKEQVAW